MSSCKHICIDFFFFHTSLNQIMQEKKKLCASFQLEKKGTFCLGSMHIHTCFWQSLNFSIAHYNLWTIKNCLSCSLKRWMQDQQCYTKAIWRLHCTCALLCKINKGLLENWNWWLLRTVFRNTFSSKYRNSLNNVPPWIVSSFLKKLSTWKRNIIQFFSLLKLLVCLMSSDIL